MNPVTFQILGANSGFVDLTFNITWNNLTPESEPFKNIRIDINAYVKNGGINSIATVRFNKNGDIDFSSSVYETKLVSKDFNFNNGSVKFKVEKINVNFHLSISDIHIALNSKPYETHLRKKLENPKWFGSLSHFNTNIEPIADSVREQNNLQIINIRHYNPNVVKIKELPKVVNIDLEYESFIEEINNDFDRNNTIIYSLFSHGAIENNDTIGSSIVYPAISSNTYNLHVDSNSPFSGFSKIYYNKSIEVWLYSSQDDVDTLKSELYNLFGSIPVDIEKLIKFRISKNNIPSDIIVKITNQSGSEIYWDSSKNTSKDAFILSSSATTDFNNSEVSPEHYDFIRYTGTLETSLFFRFYKADGTLFKRFIIRPINVYQEFDFPTLGQEYDLKQQLLNYLKYGS